MIKDIWQEEVYNTASGCNNPMNTTLSQHGNNLTHPTTSAFNNIGNHGSTAAATGRGATVRLQPIADTISDINQTLLSTNNANGNINNGTRTEVPMPISWLSDISEHIKTLKEMNDFQTDEVFQIVNMLHNGESD